ncbi:MAG: SixA phosphatase family protein [Promethearchaeota archaeon]
MRIYLIQHALAKSKSEDPDRGLTNNGIEILRNTAMSAQKLTNIAPNQIFHSGKLRAKQTAEILAEYFPPKEGLFEKTGLLPLDDPEIWVNELNSIEENTMIIGHLPFLENFCTILLNRQENTIKFENAGIIALERTNETTQVRNQERNQKKIWKFLFQIHPVVQ